MSRRLPNWFRSAADAVSNVGNFVADRFHGGSSIRPEHEPEIPERPIWEGEEPGVEARDRGLLEEAEIRTRMGDAEGAIASLQNHILRRPGDDAVLVRLARLKRDSGDAGAAMRISIRSRSTKSTS